MDNLEDLTIEEIDKRIHELELQRDAADNMQLALKIFINAAYGAMGNEYFKFYNTNVAEAVTLQGQHLIKSTRKHTNDYFQNHWQNDTELHKRLNIKNVVPINDNVTKYIDTDSCFFELEKVYKSCTTDKDPIDFIMDLDEKFFVQFFQKWHDDYAANFNTENIQFFEFEKLAKNAIWQAKKNYTLNLVMKDGVFNENFINITYHGIKIVKGSTPKFTKDILIKFLYYLFEHDGKINHNELVSMVLKWKKEFLKSDIQDISESSGISDYNKYVLNDTKGSSLTLQKRIGKHIRSAANYNYFLNNNPKYKQKYNLIHSGDKVVFYDSVANYDLPDDVFGFLQNDFPYEFAPEIDYKKMFNKWVIDQINIFLKSMNEPLLKYNLTRVKKLF